ncbi:MAG: hypothetical protein BMS9Abin24_158 [Thermodesulfobacteriota bacterium]|nr:MAG: hypothetical protein BMS9Abin24_158 [Thermodesulfobacteriota bacterium]
MKKIIPALAVFIALAFMPAFFACGAQAAPASPASPAGQAAVATPTIADAFVGEQLTYKIGFWLFDEVGQGSFSLKREEDGTYTGTLEAHTTGNVKRFILNRTDAYVSHMLLSEDGQRFVTLSFEEFVTMRGKTRKKRRVFDYANNRMTWTSWGKDGKESTGEETYPGDIVPSDPIAAFYNFRFGAYGPVERGGEYVIHAMPKGGKVPKITIRIATSEEVSKRPGKRPETMEYLADARIDKELFGSSTGDMEISFTREMTPVFVVAKDLIFFGDVRGSLISSRLADSARVLASGGRAAAP